MIGRGTAIGLSLLSMLVFCAFAAPSAFATLGTTGFTCVKDDAKPAFQDAHCKEAWVSGGGYRHEEIEPGKETAITSSNRNTKNNTTEHTPVQLTLTVGGLKGVITCTSAHGTGTQTDNPGPPMSVIGTTTLEISECTATLSGKACESVNEGKAVIGKAVTSTPTEAMEVKFEEDKEAFTSFNIKCAGKNFACTLVGSATGIPEGATVKFTKASTEGIPPESNKTGLFVGGSPATFEGTLTVTMSTTEPGLTLTTTAS